MSQPQPARSLYLHINNGGVTFAVEDAGHGPTVVVSACHFGHETARTAVYVKPEALMALGEMFLAAARDSYSRNYSVAARLPDDDGDLTGGNDVESFGDDDL